jgi:hypothetical protein
VYFKLKGSITVAVKKTSYEDTEVTLSTNLLLLSPGLQQCVTASDPRALESTSIQLGYAATDDATHTALRSYFCS